VKLVPGFVKRPFIRLVRVVIRHPVAHLVHPLAVELSNVKGELAAMRAQLTEMQAWFEHSAADRQAAIADLDQRQRTTQALVATVELAVEDVVERIERNETRSGDSSEAIARLESEAAADRSELRMQRSRLEVVLREARRALPTASDEQLQTLNQELERLLGDEYGDFETAFRGSRDVVRERQKAYLEDALALKALNAPLLDLGCGRGEWLELLRDHGVPAYGVDTNDRFAEENRERGLDVRLEDALAHIRGLPESSVAGVTAFHLIEHLGLESLLDLVEGALRVLKPGGLLLFETPNPNNLSVGASTFHIDPTHQKPVHPLWLEFLLTTRGFVDVELRYLNTAPEAQLTVPAVDGGDREALRAFVEQANALIFGPRDYAALARKSAPVPG
jgi:SAM-dependent methyltransferase